MLQHIISFAHPKTIFKAEHDSVYFIVINYFTELVTKYVKIEL